MSAVLQLGVFQRFDGSRKPFVLTTDRLLTYDPLTLIITDVTTGYNGNLHKRASFEFLNNKAFFVNGVDPIQVWDGVNPAQAVDTNGLVDTCDSIVQFYRHIIAVKPTMSGTYFPQRMYSSNLDADGWAPSIGSDATFFDIPEGQDFIVAAKRYSNYIAIYKQRSIHLVSYVGSPMIYVRQMIVPNRGAISPFCVADIGNAHLFISHDNIYAFVGNEIVAIGSDIREKFFDELAPERWDEVGHYVNHKTSEVYWLYHTDAEVENYQRALVYNWVEKNFTFREMPFTTVGVGLVESGGEPLDEEAVNFFAGNADGDIFWLDKGYSADGEPIMGYVESGAIGGYSAVRLSGFFVPNARGTFAFQVASGDAISTIGAYSAPQTAVNHKVALRAHGRFVRYRIISDDFCELSELHMMAKLGGKR